LRKISCAVQPALLVGFDERPDKGFSALSTRSQFLHKSQIRRYALVLDKTGSPPGEGCPEIAVLLVDCLVFASNDVLVHKLAVRFGKSFRPKLESQLGNFAGKVERHLVVVVIYWRAGVHADVESLVQG